MSLLTHHEMPIPGTYMFDGRAAMKGYALNKMCFSFNKAQALGSTRGEDHPCVHVAWRGKLSFIVLLCCYPHSGS